MADAAPATDPDDRAAALAEAYKRGILPPDMKAAYEEAATRGLVPKPTGKFGTFMKAQPTEQPSKDLPRWDVTGDIWRAAKGSMQAAGSDLQSAFPSATAEQAKNAENRKNYGLVGGLAKSAIVDTVGRAGSALKVPLDVLGAVASPVTGAAHGVLGSALSYIMPTSKLAHPFSPIDPSTWDTSSPENRKRIHVDPKAEADDAIDFAAMMFGPEGMKGGVAGIDAATARQAADRAAAAADREAYSKTRLSNKAKDAINARAKADGLTAQQVLDAQTEANKTGDKITLMDLGKKNLKGLAGTIYRKSGEAGSQIGDFLDARDKAAGSALRSGIRGSVGDGSTFNAMKDLFKARSAAAGPAFADAFRADSTAPFESQFRDSLTSITGKKGQIAKQIKAIETESPGALASRGAAGAATREKYMDLHDQLQQAETDRHQAMDVFKRAQADRTANAPGAVWSPRLQQFMDNPEIQSGLKKALKLEKQDSVSESRPFKDKDFGIVGTDEHGDPVIGAVPTMKSLAVAKEGLDARIADLKDPVTGRPTKAGLSLKKFRDEFVNELDRLNPKYKVAREAWSGPSQTIDAINEGKQHFSRPDSDEEVLSDFKQLSKGDKDFYRLGAAEAKIDATERAPRASDKSKRVINSDRDEKRFRMLFDSDADAQKFIDSVERKRTMFETKNAIKGGSQTAERQADDNSELQSAMLHMGHGVAHASSGNYLAMAASFLRARKDLKLIKNPEMNAELAKLLLDHKLQVGPSPGVDLLRKTPLPALKNHLAKEALRAARVALPRRAPMLSLANLANLPNQADNQ